MAKRVLNVGGGASRHLPPLYHGWTQDLLDIDPTVKPDLCCDAKRLKTQPRSTYDAVFCSHNLEHFYHHEVPLVLAGMRHVLKGNGFAHIAVPDVAALMEAVVNGKRDIMDIWYTVQAGPIRFHDVLYGWSREVERGNRYYCHLTNFTEKSLTKALQAAGFLHIYTARDGYNLTAFAFQRSPTLAQRKECGL